MTREERQAAKTAGLAAAPYAVVTVSTTGIHPATARVVAVDAITINAQGEIADAFYQVINPAVDPGPYHLHGLKPEEVAAGRRFDQVLSKLTWLLDGRTVILAELPSTWGFLVYESRRAVKNSTRIAHQRARQKGARRRRVGHVPRPEALIDVAATARRQGIHPPDPRIHGLATHLGFRVNSDAVISRSIADSASTLREETMLTWMIYQQLQQQGPVVSYQPDDLRSDPVGNQRSLVRINAAKAAQAQTEIPVRFSGSLLAGQEVVLAPEIDADPDQLIEQAMNLKLFYREKLTRETSLLVSNAQPPYAGKTMHAARKDIPIITDQEFLRLAAAAQENSK